MNAQFSPSEFIPKTDESYNDSIPGPAPFHPKFMPATIAPEDGDVPLISFFDKKFTKSRELLVFMEETKLWQEKLTECTARAGVNAVDKCSELFLLVQERIVYFNSRFNPDLRPTKTPGLPPEYEGGRVEPAKKQ